MTRTVFYTATTLNGFLADDDDSLDWLFVVPGASEAESGISGFLAGMGALVMGSTTYRWILDHDDLLNKPDSWAYGDRPTFVLTSRRLPAVPHADIRFRSGPPTEYWDELVAAAGDRDVWIIGGGDLVGQFADTGLLDEIRVSIAPVTLVSGRPLLPRRLESDRLRLVSVAQAGQFAELVYAVSSDR